MDISDSKRRTRVPISVWEVLTSVIKISSCTATQVHLHAACARKGKGTSDFRSVSVVQVILSREGHTSVESIRDYKVMTILLRRIETHRKLNRHIEQYTILVIVNQYYRSRSWCCLAIWHKTISLRNTRHSKKSCECKKIKIKEIKDKNSCILKEHHFWRRFLWRWA